MIGGGRDTVVSKFLSFSKEQMLKVLILSILPFFLNLITDLCLILNIALYICKKLITIIMDNLKDEVRKSHLPKVGDIRFIERFVEIDANTGRMVKILQQFSLDSNSGEFGEYKWIDVPLIKQ